MIALGKFYTRDEILVALSAEYVAVHDFFASISTEAFFAAPDQVWSPAENLIHLRQSNDPIALLLSAPRTVLRLRFGKAKQPSTSFRTVRTNYTDVALANGGVAPGGYIPSFKHATQAEKIKILNEWTAVCTKIEKQLATWSEADLDKYQAPHPLLGRMTIRDLMFFTLYHNMHHVNDVQRLLAMPQTEWFDLS
ncbi:MAG: DinB family protein [Candidatus Promineifilaceae bacterium]